MVLLESLLEEDAAFVRDLIARHVQLTGSLLGARILDRWDTSRLRFLRVIPVEYKKALQAQQIERLGVAV
jgi:glutamate synthase (NADPH) large chain